MEIEGNHVIKKSASVLWENLNDPNVLVRITPGIQELITLSQDRFKAVSLIKIGPIKARFEGELAMEDKVKHEQMVVTLSQNSKIGNVSAAITIMLKTQDDETTISYKGAAEMTGKLATMGQRIIGSVVSSLSKQFFVNLENEFKTTH